MALEYVDPGRTLFLSGRNRLPLEAIDPKSEDVEQVQAIFLINLAGLLNAVSPTVA